MDFAKNIKLLIFDFDGTLHSLAIDWQKMRQTAGVADTDEPLGKAIERFKQQGDEKTLAKITRIEAESIQDQILDTAIKQVLDRLKEHFQLAILSRNSSKVIREFLTRGGINDIYIVGREDTKRLKPHPEGIKKILEHFNVSADEALLVGDTSHDTLAANSAGISSVIVGDNYSASALRPKYRIAKFTQLEKLLF